MIWKQYFRNLVTIALKFLVQAYRLIFSPVVGAQCRFWPSCSDYALQAFDAHRPARALSLILRRLLRCHPFHPGGLDPIPKTKA